MNLRVLVLLTGLSQCACAAAQMAPVRPNPSRPPSELRPALSGEPIQAPGFLGSPVLGKISMTTEMERKQERLIALLQKKIVVLQNETT